MDIDIQAAQQEDFESIALLTNNSYRTPYKPSLVTTKANDSLEKIKKDIDTSKSVIFIAKNNNQIIGSVRCRKEEANLFVYKLAVDPNFREKGVAKRLLEHTFSYFKNLGGKAILVKVIEEKGLIPFYESFNFQILKKHLNTNGHNEVLMRREI